MGGDYYIGSGDVNQNPDELLFVEDKVDYDAESFARSLGIFFQVEHSVDAVNVYLNLSFANTGYNRIDLFNYSYSDPKRETGWNSFPSHTLKAGLNYNFDNNHNAYFNIGNYSKAPLSMNVYSYTNETYSDVKNEKVFSVELGYGYKSNKSSIRLNAFLTSWKDKAFNFSYYEPISYQAYQFNIYGAEALHQGIEGEEIFNRLNFYLNPKIVFNGHHYPHLNISGRNDISQRAEQPAAIPNYYLLNIHLGFNWNGAVSFIKNINFGVNIYNLLDEDYLVEAYESVTRDPQSQTLWLGRERWMDFSLMFNI